MSDVGFANMPTLTRLQAERRIGCEVWGVSIWPWEGCLVLYVQIFSPSAQREGFLIRLQALLEADEQLQGLYMMLDRVDVHCVWVSQAVLDLLPAEIPDVPGGEIIRDPGKGVFCDNAMDMITALWPRPGREKKRRFVTDAMRKLHEVGLVGMHDAGAMPDELALFQEMEKTDDWTLRVYSMLECKERNTFCPDQTYLLDLESSLLSVRSVKLFAGKPV